MDLVSIIIPVYNSEKYLRNCLDSVVNQTYTNIEIIIINDGSTDNSQYILEEYARVDVRIKLLHKKNSGVSDTRNIGIKLSKGKYILFIDSDDVVDKTYIQELVTPTWSKDYDLVLCNVNDVYDDHISKRIVKAAIEGDFYKEYNGLIKVTRIPSLKLYKSQIIKKYNLKFRKDICFMEDQIFNFQYFEYVDRYYFVDKALYHYYHRNNMSLSQKITNKAFWGNAEKLKYASAFYRKYKIKNAEMLLNEQVHSCLKKFAMLSDGYNDKGSFAYRVKVIKDFYNLEIQRNTKKKLYGCY